MVESPSEFPKSPKDELYLQPQSMIEIDIEAVAVAGVAEPHKEVAVAKLHEEEVDLVKAQNTVQVIVVGNREEVALPKDAAQEEVALPKDAAQETPPKDAAQEEVALPKEAAQEDKALPEEAAQEDKALPEDAVQEEVTPPKEATQEEVAQEDIAEEAVALAEAMV